MGFCFVFVSCLTWKMDNGTPRNPYLFDLIMLTFVILEVLPRWWFFHQKPGYIYLLSTCGAVVGASISLERAHKNSVC